MIQHPTKKARFADEMLAFRTEPGFFRGAAKVRSTSGRPHERAAKRLRMGVLEAKVRTRFADEMLAYREPRSGCEWRLDGYGDGSRPLKKSKKAYKSGILWYNKVTTTIKTGGSRSC